MKLNEWVESEEFHDLLRSNIGAMKQEKDRVAAMLKLKEWYVPKVKALEPQENIQQIPTELTLTFIEATKVDSETSDNSTIAEPDPAPSE